MEEFRIQKDDLLAKFAAIEEKLKEQENEHNEVLYELERKQVVDKDRYVKDQCQNNMRNKKMQTATQEPKGGLFLSLGKILASIHKEEK